MSPEQDGLFHHPRGEQLTLGENGVDATPPLDRPQVFAEASSYQIRDELQALVERDLLGPWGG
ncbi:MAG: hypothetical protein IRY92_07595, partial [Dactylosporangium sp.]|nr:hypothetical protein [Dactylosporangium sp.]